MEFQKPSLRFAAPYPMAFYKTDEGEFVITNVEKVEPNAGGLHREKSRLNQVRQDTKTLIWGDGDSLPLRILDAVYKSPTASSCLGKIEKFIRGSGFSDKGLEEMVVDENGTTLLQLHSYNSQYMAYLEGFGSNFKYNAEGVPKITNAFGVPIEGVRFKKETEDSTEIKCLAYNPYFGSNEYINYQTEEYPFFDPKNVGIEQEFYGDTYKGQMYFYGRVRPLYKFYPVPKYWSGENWIYVDGQIQAFHKNNLSNGFFQSAMLNVIGDPNEWSQDPRYMTKVTGTDGTERDQPTKTVGEVFNIEMAKTFSGVNKAGSVFVMWSLNEQQYVKVSAMPVNTSFDVMSGTFTDAIRGITIATEVPAILANLPQQASSLGSDGNAMRVAIELMTANAKDAQNQLETFYNTILIPNHVNGSKTAKVKLLPYSPVTIQVPVDKQFWDFMNENERVQYIKDNVPTIKIDPMRLQTAPAVPGQVVPQTPQPTQEATNDVLRGLSASEQDKLFRIIRKYADGKIDLNMAQTMLKSGYNLTDEQISKVLGVGDTQAL